MSIDNKVILLTGGTGSFGQAFVKIALEKYSPKAIRVFSRGELAQFEMRQKFNDDKRLRFHIGDVRDRERVYRAMNGVDIVVHAAALKQVPACEYNPIEAVKTNIDGTTNIIDAAIDNQVKKAIAISTDKAVSPANLYGATKLVMERLFIQANVYGPLNTRFACVRYGNVIGSRGSVIPLFRKQLELGKITITDERMTRFWITLHDGVQLVIDSIGRIEGGEVFVPKIASMRITEIADTIAPGCEKEIIGIRPGEKIHEILVTEDEARHTKEFDTYFVIEPEHHFWEGLNHSKGKPLPSGFEYTSDTNDQWVTHDQFIEMLNM